MSTPVAGVDELQDWLGVDFTTAERRQADQFLRGASALVRSEAGETWLDDVPEVIVTVVKQCAARKFVNPAGAVTDTAGPFSTDYGPDAARGLYLTDDEKASIHRELGTGAVGVWTLSTTRSDLRASDTATIWAPDAGGGDPIPMIEVEPT